MHFFAPKRTFQLVIILNISQIHFTLDFSFNNNLIGGQNDTNIETSTLSFIETGVYSNIKMQVTLVSARVNSH